MKPVVPSVISTINTVRTVLSSLIYWLIWHTILEIPVIFTAWVETNEFRLIYTLLPPERAPHQAAKRVDLRHRGGRSTMRRTPPLFNHVFLQHLRWPLNKSLSSLHQSFNHERTEEQALDVCKHHTRWRVSRGLSGLVPSLRRSLQWYKLCDNVTCYSSPDAVLHATGFSLNAR